MALTWCSLASDVFWGSYRNGLYYVNTQPYVHLGIRLIIFTHVCQSTASVCYVPGTPPCSLQTVSYFSDTINSTVK